MFSIAASSSVTKFSPLNVLFHNSKLAQMLCAVSQTHYNPACNLNVCGTDNGDMIFMNTREFHFDDTLAKAMNNAQGISLLDIMPLQSEQLPKFIKGKIEDDWQMCEPDYKQKYGLVFGPVGKVEYTKT